MVVKFEGRRRSLGGSAPDPARWAPLTWSTIFTRARFHTTDGLLFSLFPNS